MFCIDLLLDHVEKLIAKETLYFLWPTKLNEILVEKIEEATNIAQDAPEILKKEFDSLKESIIKEASRMEKAENIQENETTNTYQNSIIKKTLHEIEDINKQIDRFNKTMNNQIKWVITFFKIF